MVRNGGLDQEVGIAYSRAGGGTPVLNGLFGGQAWGAWVCLARFNGPTITTESSTCYLILVVVIFECIPIFYVP